MNLYCFIFFLQPTTEILSLFVKTPSLSYLSYDCFQLGIAIDVILLAMTAVISRVIPLRLYSCALGFSVSTVTLPTRPSESQVFVGGAVFTDHIYVSHALDLYFSSAKRSSSQCLCMAASLIFLTSLVNPYHFSAYYSDYSRYCNLYLDTHFKSLLPYSDFTLFFF